MRAEPIAEHLAEIVGRARQAPDAPRALVTRMGLLADGDQAARFVRHCLDELAKGGVSPVGRRCVDVGAGAGAHAVTMLLAGARRVDAIEASSDYVEAMRWLAGREPALGGLLAHHADATALPLDDHSAGLVWSNETLGVFPRLEAALAEMARVVARPDGAIVLLEANDALNPLVRARSRRLARAYEQGPVGVHHGHVIALTYEDRRAARIARLRPDLDARGVRRLAQGTAHRTWPEIEAMVEAHRGTGAWPTSTFDPRRPAVDPDGALTEAVVEPQRVTDALERDGLVVELHGRWGGAGGRRVLRAADRVLDRLGPVARRSAANITYVARPVPVRPIGREARDLARVAARRRLQAGRSEGLPLAPTVRPRRPRPVVAPEPADEASAHGARGDA